MLTLYFSGTGNSKFAAQLFSNTMECACFSIEEKENFPELIRQSDTIAFVYPVYLSRVPRIMREFARAHRLDLRGKKLVILATQEEFSGDGARCFTDLLRKGTYEVIYAEQIKMPNNINNMKVFKAQSEQLIEQLTDEARAHIAKICNDLKTGVVFKRDFNLRARLLGLPQGIVSPLFTWIMKRGIRVDKDCTGCGLCVKRCPMHNLSLKDGRASGAKNCTVCYRCINLCPERAINLFFPGKVTWQYHGIKEKHGNTSV